LRESAATSAAAETLCCVGAFVIVAGRVAVLAVVKNNTVAYKKESRVVRCYTFWGYPKFDVG